MAASQLQSSRSPIYAPTQPYGSRHFVEPPRRAIPPPTLEYREGKPSFAVDNLKVFEYGTSGYGNPAFLQSIVGCGDFTLPHSMLAWKYEMRRSAQYILPFLLLGPSSAARDADFIRDEKITFLIAVRSAMAARARPKFLNPATFASAKGLAHLTIDLDNPYEMRANLRPTIKLMNDHLEKSCKIDPIKSFNDIEGKILIFCESGNDRSVALAAAYVMVVFGSSMVKTIQMIQSQRFCICPDDAMKDMLGDLETYLQAEREVAHFRSLASLESQSQPSPPTALSLTLNKPSKRSIDRAYESDDEMIDLEWPTEDYGGQKARGVQAPFTDVAE